MAPVIWPGLLKKYKPPGEDLVAKPSSARRLLFEIKGAGFTLSLTHQRGCQKIQFHPGDFLLGGDGWSSTGGS